MIDRSGGALEPFARAGTPRDKTERSWVQALQRYRLVDLENELAAVTAELAENSDNWPRFVAVRAEVEMVRGQVSASDED